MRALPRKQFEDLVREAIEGLPEEFLARLDNVDVVVEDRPTPEQLDKNEIGSDGTLFGLYEGIPLTERHDYSLVVPDKITIFQRPLEQECETHEGLIAEVQATVVHEVAHFFGISDEALEEMGLG
jgi:predicted Zn-dependent protease with MMP-like domain